MKKFRNKKYNIDINNMTANKICRLCCLERISSKSKNIFVAKIREMVEKCSSLRVSEDDGLPTHICRTCLLTLTKFYAFRKNIERTDKILKKKFGQIKSKQDILDIALNKAQIESYNEHVYSDDVSFISPGEVGSIKPQVKVDNFSDINSNEDVGEILEYFIESADYKGIKLIKNNTLETNSVQLLKNSENS
ncbi:hypothetical protein HHI36_000026 [Cryptolaemus montrouzieri]|uniref:ZAD domain-containing protein n=1 Tax=Cryptolaemus montrouzieri TaxID=559131 RepID=A0ABD2P3M8_9CUCU